LRKKALNICPGSKGNEITGNLSSWKTKESNHLGYIGLN
jgi:hypothetical protein